MRSMKNLMKHCHSKYSSLDSGLIDYILSKVYTDTFRSSNYFVEFGVHGITPKGESGVALEHLIDRGYHAILIEADKEACSEVQQIYQQNPRVQCINSKIEVHGDKSLDNILSNTNIPSVFDLIVIDVDSYDYQIWEALTKYLPIIVVIEINETYGPTLDRVYNEKIDKIVNGAYWTKGSSIKAINKLAQRKGYALLTFTRNNAIFIKAEFFHLFHLKEVDIDKHASKLFLYVPNNILSYRQLFQKVIYYWPIFLKRRFKRFLPKKYLTHC